MIGFNLTQLKQALQAEHTGADAYFEQVSIDTRTINPGELFIAVKGPNFDGHNFIETALQQGAAAAMVSEPVTTSLPTLQVRDTVVALGQLAGLRRNQLKVPVLAITGSCGKTTTKTMMSSILSHCGAVHAGKKSFNNHYGLPLTLLGATKEHQYVVVEMGANHPHEIAYLTQIARPTIAGITLAAPVHLEGFGSVLGVANAKGEIFQGLTNEGVACINIDDFHADLWRELAGAHRILTFGYSKAADFHPTNISVDESSHPRFIMHTPIGQVQITLPLLGEHNVLNALAAAALTFSAKASLEAIQRGLENVTPVDKRMVKRVNEQGIEIFDDSYNANPVGVEAALKVLTKENGKKVFVLGEMAELGELAELYHRQLGQQALDYGVEHLFAVGKMAKHTVEAFGKGAQYFINQSELIEQLQSFLSNNCTMPIRVLVKGSRSMRMEQVVEALMSKREV